jgi:hypothetical protein
MTGKSTDLFPFIVLIRKIKDDTKIGIEFQGCIKRFGIFFLTFETFDNPCSAFGQQVRYVLV